MARMVSFFVLLTILLVFGGLFVFLMADFLLPLFLSLLLVVMFGPVHRWLTDHLRGHRRWAALATAVLIALAVLLPLSGIMTMAGVEGVRLYDDLSESRIDLHDVSRELSRWAGEVGWQLSPDAIERDLIDRLRQLLTPMVLRTPGYLAKLVVGVCVMMLGVYFFFADGPVMIRAVMRLSPLDDRYEEQLISQFDSISRAVVLATLLSAIAQGFLAGIGYYFTGLGSVVLLALLTGLLAMVPFVGAAAVWFPVSLWLFFVENRPVAAIVLFLYGALIVSMVDNLIKPAVLHGRASLHPLLALLSVIGGVQALGPIGIFVGPMVVVFFQSLLNMLHDELERMGADVSLTPEKLEEAVQTKEA